LRSSREFRPGAPEPPEPRIPAPIQPRSLLVLPSAASYSRPASRAKGAPRHGPSAIGSMHSRVQRPWAREPHILRDAFAKHPSRTATAFTCSRNCWGTATPAHHELHAGPEAQARHRPEHGQAGVRPMSRLAAFRGIRGGIGCSSMQPNRSSEGRSGHGQRAATKGLGVVRRGSPPSGRRGRSSQELPYYAGQPIQCPNCS